MEQLCQLFFLLICGHALADFAFQSEWIAINKNRHSQNKFSADDLEKTEVIWPWVLTAHTLIHGLMVFLVTQKLILGVCEVIVHWLIDLGKNERLYGFRVDQVFHVLTKVVWLILIAKQIV